MEVYFENRTWPHAKFYRLEMDLVLFDVCLKREWGRIGRKKREKIEYFKTWKEANKTFQRIYLRRIQHGYKVIKTKKTNRSNRTIIIKQKEKESHFKPMIDNSNWRYSTSSRRKTDLWFRRQEILGFKKTSSTNERNPS